MKIEILVREGETVPINTVLAITKADSPGCRRMSNRCTAANAMEQSTVLKD